MGKLASCQHRRDDLLMQGIVFVLAREPRITTGCECRRELDGFLLHARARITQPIAGRIGLKTASARTTRSCRVLLVMHVLRCLGNSRVTARVQRNVAGFWKRC